MRALKYYVFPRSEVENLFRSNPIPPDALQRYEDARPDVLHDATQDIFAPNSRSERQRWQRWDLFERVTDPVSADFVVCQAWLEICEAYQVSKNIPLLLNHLIETFPGKPIVTSWNHDRDAASLVALNNLPSNVLVIQYNTSKATPNDVLVSFWNVATLIEWHPKRFWARFRGYIGNVPVRNRLRDAVAGRPDYLVTDNRLPEPEYLKELAETTFALCPRGGGLSSYRYGEAIQCGAIPVLFGDDAVLPYPDLDYTKFSVRVPEAALGNFDRVDVLLKSLDANAMRREILEVAPRFSLIGCQMEVYNRLREIL